MSTVQMINNVVSGMFVGAAMLVAVIICAIALVALCDWIDGFYG
jgi:uncharacterized SAM-binding protein YcdF (DUF218 family)